MKRKDQDFLFSCETGLKQLHEKVVTSPSGYEPLEQLDASRRECDKLLGFIDEQLPLHIFDSEDLRLRFYKEILTSVIAVKVFCRERYYLQVNRRGATASGITLYYESQLILLEAFEERFGFFKGYNRSGQVNLDSLYYLPGQDMEMVLLPEVVLPAGLQLGCCTYLFARFKAGIMMRGLLVSRIDGKTEDQLPNPSIPPKKKSFVQTRLNLSVDQLGMGARAAFDAMLISGKSFQQICEELAPRVSTLEKELVSAGSMRSNAYTGEDVDKHTLIRYLEKMIRLIRDY